jgi:hypothetical protein
MAIYLYFSWVLGAFILAVEGARYRRGARIDPLSFISVMFFLVFVIAPNVVAATPRVSPLLPRFAWLDRLPTDAAPYVVAAVLASLGYLGVLGGYHFRLAPASGRLVPIERASGLVLAGVLFLALGAASFIAYTQIVGGVVKTLLLADILRADPTAYGIGSKFIFVKRLTLFCLPATLFFIQSLAYIRGRSRRAMVISLALLSFLWSLAVLEVYSGRLIFMAFLWTFLMPAIMKRPRNAVIGGAMMAVVAIPAILYGKSLVNALTIPGYAPKVELSAEGVVGGVFLEFSPPFANLLNIIEKAPGEIPFRGFIDIPLTLIRLVPQQLVPMTLPPPVVTVNTRALVGDVPWSVPVDLLSYGWYCGGIGGMAVVSIVFGRFARAVNSLLPAGLSYGADMLRSTWILIIGFVVMYGEPDWLIIEQFHWIVALVVYLGLMTRWRPYARSPRSARAIAST